MKQGHTQPAAHTAPLLAAPAVNSRGGEGGWSRVGSGGGRGPCRARPAAILHGVSEISSSLDASWTCEFSRAMLGAGQVPVRRPKALGRHTYCSVLF